MSNAFQQNKARFGVQNKGLTQAGVIIDSNNFEQSTASNRIQSRRPLRHPQDLAAIVMEYQQPDFDAELE